MNTSGIGLVVLVVVLVLVLNYLNVYLMVKWQDPNDSAQWLVPKLVIVSGMTLVELIIFGLPIDVANHAGHLDCSYDFGDDSKCPGLDMVTYWYALFVMAFVWGLVFVPFCFLAYESNFEEDTTKSALLLERESPREEEKFSFYSNMIKGFGHVSWREAVLADVLIVALFAFIFGVMYAYENRIRLPFERYEMNNGTVTIGGRAKGVA